MVAVIVYKKRGLQSFGSLFLSSFDFLSIAILN